MKQEKNHQIVTRFDKQTKDKITKRANEMGLTGAGLIRWVMINFLRGKR